MIHPDPRVESAMLAELGARVIGSIVATMTLGHTRLAHTIEYGDVSADPAASLVRAIIDGRIDRVETALERWAVEGSERACAAVEALTGEAIDRPAKPPTALDVQRAAMGRAMSRISA